MDSIGMANWFQHVQRNKQVGFIYISLESTALERLGIGRNDAPLIIIIIITFFSLFLLSIQESSLGVFRVFRVFSIPQNDWISFTLERFCTARDLDDINC